MNPDIQIKVTSKTGLNHMDISMISSIENAIDQSLVPLGFSRTTTTKAGDSFELNYRQFGKCLNASESDSE